MAVCADRTVPLTSAEGQIASRHVSPLQLALEGLDVLSRRGRGGLGQLRDGLQSSDEFRVADLDFFQQALFAEQNDLRDNLDRVRPQEILRQPGRGVGEDADGDGLGCHEHLGMMMM